VIITALLFIKGTKVNILEKFNDPNILNKEKKAILSNISPALFIQKAKIAALLA
jgi:hypothetical protein